MDPLLSRVYLVWEQLAGVPSAFAERPLSVVHAPGSRLCPPQWVGIVSIEGATLVTAPTGQLADRLRTVLTGLPADALTDGERLKAALPIAETLGPATLGYVSTEAFCAHRAARVEPMPVGHPAVAGLISSVPDEDARESAIDQITSPAFVVRRDGQVVAAAGYRIWVGMAAHLSVLTAEAARGQGLARVVASAATQHALDHGLLPQWRARPLASRRVAQHLGFRELGSQLSVRLDRG